MKMTLPHKSGRKLFKGPFAFLFLATLVLASCTKTDTLRIFAHQANGDPAFGSEIDIYPSESNYLVEPIPVVSGQANQSADNGQALFEIEDLFSGPHYFDIVYHDSIGNWAVAGAENSFTAISKGGETIEVSGPGLALNHHRFLLPSNGESRWRLVDIRDNAGTSILSTFPPCVNDNSLLLSKDLSIEHAEGSSVCTGQPQTASYNFTHNGSSLSVQNFEGQSGTTVFTIVRSERALHANIAGDTWVYVRD